MVESFRFVSRKANQLHFVGDLSTWPLDVPLPEQTTISGMGADPIPPFWTFTLEETQTTEQLQAWLQLPLNLEASDHWFLTKLAPCGWYEVKRLHFPLNRLYIDYHHATETAWRLRINISYNDYNGETRAMIWRIITHPYPTESKSLDLTA